MFSCSLMSDPVDSSPPGCPANRILQARIPEWLAMPSSRGSRLSLLLVMVINVGCGCFVSCSVIWLFATLRTGALQAPLSMKFSSWVGLPLPSPGDISDPRIKPRSAELQVDSLPSEPPGKFSLSKSLSASLTSREFIRLDFLCPGNYTSRDPCYIELLLPRAETLSMEPEAWNTRGTWVSLVEQVGLPGQVVTVRLSSGNYSLQSSEDLSISMRLFLKNRLEVW